jgi:DNA-binding IclR family transcriptional regulator
MSVAVAISRPDGALCAVNVSVPAHRMSPGLRTQLGARLQAAAEDLRGLLV